MSAVAVEGTAQPTFNRKVVFWGILASLFAAAGFFLLATYAPDFKYGRQGGATALSKSGIGFAGIVKLLDLSGHDPIIGKGPSDELGEDYSLMVVTISPDADSEIFAEIVKAREGMPTLFVLPKWQTIPMPNREGWEMKTRQLAANDVQRWLSMIGEYKLATDKASAKELALDGVSIAAPEGLQTMAAGNGVIEAGPSSSVLLEIPDNAFFVLSDPDLLNNQSLKDPAGAAFALNLIEVLSEDAEGITFDMTLYGAARKHDMFKLLVEPPFLALTLSVLAAAALAFLHGLGRFGPAEPESRAIPFGKQALVDTTATLFRRAGRLGDMGERYAALMRTRAGTLLGAPQGLQAEPLDQWLDSLNRDDEEQYSDLSRALRSARTETDVTAAARRLHQWIGRRIGERN